MRFLVRVDSIACFKRESSEGTVGTTTESDSLSLSKHVVTGRGDWELVALTVSEIHVLWVCLGVFW